MSIFVKVLEENCKPHKTHDSDAGVDLKVNSDKPITLIPGLKYKLDTGIQVAIPRGFAGFVMPRSGLGTKYGIKLNNTVGLIDPDYRGNVFVSISTDEEYTLQPYERFAQLVIVPVLLGYEFVDELDDTARGDGGFGSTGGV